VGRLRSSPTVASGILAGVGPDSYVLKTYRFLRLAMVALVLLLFAAVVIEVVQAGGCVRTSLSSYWWTPARGAFVGALVAIGACLIIIKGNTEVEDVLLNIAGLLAAVVAFVPIKDPGECVSAPTAATDLRPDVFNNVTALAVTGLVSVAVALVLARREAQRAGEAWLPMRHVVGIGSSLLMGGILLAGFLWARQLFEVAAHYVAAIPMFLILLVVMVLNARSKARTDAGQDGRTEQRADLANRYSTLAAATIALVVPLLAAKWALGWEHALLWTEVVVVLAFAVFWVLQTIELWDEDCGLRPDPEGVVGEASQRGPTPSSGVSGGSSGRRRASRG
jgi:hypothetical protein